jgi:hypothetical protein
MQQQWLSALGATSIAGACLALVCGNSGCALVDTEDEAAANDSIGVQQGELDTDLGALFTVSIEPPTMNIDVSDDAFFEILVEPLEGFSGDVVLDATSDPPWPGFFQLIFGRVTPPGFDELFVFGDCNTPVGTYNIAVTGTAEDGSTASASAVLTVDPTTFPPPNAFFFTDREGFTVEFFDSSFSSFCTEIVSRAWDFGDGATSNEENPVHTYAARGDYTVTLTVTDSQGLTDVASAVVQVLPPPPVLDIDAVTRNKSRFEFRVDLVWSGAEGDLVNLHRNNVSVDLPDNDGAHRDRFRSLQTSFRWEICELATPNFCSNEVRLDVAPNMTGDTATVTALVDGRRVVKRVPIRDE